MRHIHTVFPSVLSILPVLCFASLAAVLPTSLVAQEDEPQGPASQAQFRKIVPYVEQTIDPERDFDELYSVHHIDELIRVNPDFDWAKDRTIRQDIWALQLTFKPLRFIEADVPGSDGKLRRKLVWYMVYRVKNPGVVYRAAPTEYESVGKNTEEMAKLLGDRYVFPDKKNLKEGEIVKTKVGEPVRFMPTFLLYSRDAGKAYSDRVLPSVKSAIRKREDPNRPLKDSVEMMGEIPAATEEKDNSVYGVVTWEDIDPRTDFFSVYVQGLTNAYKWYYLEDGTRWKSYKTLRLDFWRPGDDLDEDESEIRFLRSKWVYLDRNFAKRPQKSLADHEKARLSEEELSELEQK